MQNQDLITKLAEQATYIKPAAHPYKILSLWLVATGLYVLLALYWAGIRPDLGTQVQKPFFSLEVAALLFTIVSGLLSAILLSYPDMHQKNELVRLPLFGFIGLAGVSLLSLGAAGFSLPLPDHGLICTAHITMLSVLPAAIIFYYSSRMASTHRALTGLTTTLTAFSIGALVLRLSEVTDSASHLLIWHYLPLLGASLIGVGLGRWMLRW